MEHASRDRGFVYRIQSAEVVCRVFVETEQAIAGIENERTFRVFLFFQEKALYCHVVIQQNMVTSKLYRTVKLSAEAMKKAWSISRSLVLQPRFLLER